MGRCPTTPTPWVNLNENLVHDGHLERHGGRRHHFPPIPTGQCHTTTSASCLLHGPHTAAWEGELSAAASKPSSTPRPRQWRRSWASGSRHGSISSPYPPSREVPVLVYCPLQSRRPPLPRSPAWGRDATGHGRRRLRRLHQRRPARSPALLVQRTAAARTPLGSPPRVALDQAPAA